MLIKPDTRKIDSCVAYYLQYCRAKDQSEKTVKGKAFNLALFEQWCCLVKIDNVLNVSVDVLDSYQQYLNKYRKPQNDGPLSKGTRRNRLTAVRVFLRALFIKDIIPNNHFEKFELPTLGRRLPKPVLSESEVQKVLNQASLYGKTGIRDRAIMETYYASGIRRFELGELTVDDIDFEQHQLRVYQGKGDKDRYVPFAKQGCFMIYQYLKKIRPKLANKHSGKTLFLANNGKAFRPTQLSELVAKYIKLADIRKGGACNQYRHAAATHMVDRGADIRHVQEFLGHADLSTTQIYVHVSMVKLREVYGNTHPAALI
ncbi:tyrosine-type recombinase/integrase [uncultured Paraglaciecola sp.]|uniref:tyrosine-type recombinase/integrase n=1 Tax=uncultured Paraglaciecola sp. TaxID=1765024 RepID=UPI0026006BBF|nr:tyrosine-type recombinase/integrase [uncultured Paraglaciecola sp.]